MSTRRRAHRWFLSSGMEHADLTIDTACFTRFDRSSPMSAAPRERAAATYAESA